MDIHKNNVGKISMKIIKRSKLRIAVGRVYYNLKRQIDWRFSGKRFARVRNDTCIFPIVLYQHRSPLFRDLPKVDLWLQENKVINLQIGIKALTSIRQVNLSNNHKSK
jgi:vancomycin resistance protein VanW